MATDDPETNGVEKDADAVEQKFGQFADVYAEARSEAAQIAGHQTDKEHWQEVAATVEESDEQ